MPFEHRKTVFLHITQNWMQSPRKAAGIFVFGYHNPLSADQNLSEADVLLSHVSELEKYL
jgi:hypothetical protein